MSNPGKLPIAAYPKAVLNSKSIDFPEKETVLGPSVEIWAQRRVELTHAYVCKRKNFSEYFKHYSDLIPIADREFEYIEERSKLGTLSEIFCEQTTHSNVFRKELL